MSNLQGCGIILEIFPARVFVLYITDPLQIGQNVIVFLQSSQRTCPAPQQDTGRLRGILKQIGHSIRVLIWSSKVLILIYICMHCPLKAWYDQNMKINAETR